MGKAKNRLTGVRHANKLRKHEQQSEHDDEPTSNQDAGAMPLPAGMMLLLEACNWLEFLDAQREGFREEQQELKIPCSDVEEVDAACTLPLPEPEQVVLAQENRLDDAAHLLVSVTAERFTEKLATSVSRKRRKQLHGPCCHCGATVSPQWRKGPPMKPVLCNACGTRFLRTRSLGKAARASRQTSQASGAAEFDDYLDVPDPKRSHSRFRASTGSAALCEVMSQPVLVPRTAVHSFSARSSLCLPYTASASATPSHSTAVLCLPSSPSHSHQHPHLQHPYQEQHAAADGTAEQQQGSSVPTAGVHSGERHMVLGLQLGEPVDAPAVLPIQQQEQQQQEQQQQQLGNIPATMAGDASRTAAPAQATHAPSHPSLPHKQHQTISITLPHATQQSQQHTQQHTQQLATGNPAERPAPAARMCLDLSSSLAASSRPGLDLSNDAVPAPEGRLISHARAAASDGTADGAAAMDGTHQPAAPSAAGPAPQHLSSTQHPLAALAAAAAQPTPLGMVLVLPGSAAGAPLDASSQLQVLQATAAAAASATATSPAASGGGGRGGPPGSAAAAAPSPAAAMTLDQMQALAQLCSLSMSAPSTLQALLPGGGAMAGGTNGFAGAGFDPCTLSAGRRPSPFSAVQLVPRTPAKRTRPAFLTATTTTTNGLGAGKGPAHHQLQLQQQQAQQLHHQQQAQAQQPACAGVQQSLPSSAGAGTAAAGWDGSSAATGWDSSWREASCQPLDSSSAGDDAGSSLTAGARLALQAAAAAAGVPPQATWPAVGQQPSTTGPSSGTHSMAQHSMPQHSMAQHSMPQDSMAQHSMPQHSMPQHSMPQDSIQQHSHSWLPAVSGSLQAALSHTAGCHTASGAATGAAAGHPAAHASADAPSQAGSSHPSPTSRAAAAAMAMLAAAWGQAAASEHQWSQHRQELQHQERLQHHEHMGGGVSSGRHGARCPGEQLAFDPLHPTALLLRLPPPTLQQAPSRPPHKRPAAELEADEAGPQRHHSPPHDHSPPHHHPPPHHSFHHALQHTHHSGQPPPQPPPSPPRHPPTVVKRVAAKRTRTALAASNACEAAAAVCVPAVVLEAASKLGLHPAGSPRSLQAPLAALELRPEGGGCKAAAAAPWGQPPTGMHGRLEQARPGHCADLARARRSEEQGRAGHAPGRGAASGVQHHAAGGARPGDGSGSGTDSGGQGHTSAAPPSNGFHLAAPQGHGRGRRRDAAAAATAAAVPALARVAGGTGHGPALSESFAALIADAGSCHGSGGAADAPAAREAGEPRAAAVAAVTSSPTVLGVALPAILALPAPGMQEQEHQHLQDQHSQQQQMQVQVHLQQQEQQQMQVQVHLQQQEQQQVLLQQQQVLLQQMQQQQVQQHVDDVVMSPIWVPRKACAGPPRSWFAISRPAAGRPALAQ